MPQMFAMSCRCIVNRSSSTARTRSIRAGSGTRQPAIVSTAWQNASACDAAASPDTRSTNGIASVTDRPSSSFSTPLCVKNSLPSSVMIRSPATLNRKCPGSMMPAWIGPTGIWKIPSPSTRPIG